MPSRSTSATPLRQPLLFVNPWSGRIGPNVVLRQLVIEALERKHVVHLVVVSRDAVAEQLESLGAVLHLVPSLELFPRRFSPLAILRHLHHSILEVVALRKKIDELRPALICVNSENQLLMPWASCLTRVPTVVWIHGARFGTLGLVGRLYFALQSPAVTLYVAVSETVGRSIQTLGVSAEKVVVVPNGVNLTRFAPGPSDADFREALGIPPGVVVLGTVCHLTPRKGVHHLIRILGILAQKTRDFVSLIVGEAKGHDATYREALLHDVEVAGLQNHVRFLGDRGDVDRIMRELDILIHPSETESFGCVIAEAMASGKPVMGFNVDAVGELIVQDVTGILVPAFDVSAAASELFRLIQDPARRSTMGAAGRERASRLYDASATTQSSVELLESLLSRARRESPHDVSIL